MYSVRSCHLNYGLSVGCGGPRSMPKLVRGRAPVIRALGDAASGIGSPGEFVMVQAPGRVNLIGEHTDYNGGHVLPIALGRVVGVAARSNSRAEHQVTSLNFRETRRFAVGSVPDGPGTSWVRYVAGMLREMERHAGPMPPLELLIAGDIPLGAGLSSSAALCIATGLAVDFITGCATDPVLMARTAQEVEHAYAGVQCGIMDQMASRLAISGHALLLHCDTLAYQHIPVLLNGVQIVLIDSGVRRQLATSKYNDRRQECAAALAYGRRRRPELQTLCEMDLQDLEYLQQNVLRRRAIHVMAEDARVQATAKALQCQDWVAFGQLLVQSHASLRDNYEVSCKEVDFLVEAALAVPGALGARMTGGGFGGCTVNVVREPAMEGFRSAVLEAYKNEFGLDARVHLLHESLQAGLVVAAKHWS